MGTIDCPNCPTYTRFERPRRRIRFLKVVPSAKFHDERDNLLRRTSTDQLTQPRPGDSQQHRLPPNNYC